MKKYYSAFKTKPVLIILMLSLLAGCHKDDHFPKATDESADVVFDWYKLQLRILLHANPAINNSSVINNFGYFGVGLYEAVRPGIKGSSSLSTQLYQMPQMPEKANGQKYLWAESANAVFASMMRSFGVALTDANKASIDSLENAYNAKLGLLTDHASFERSQLFGRAIATAIFNWSKSDNFIVSNAGYVPPVFPGAWEPTLPAFAGAATPFIKDARPFLQSNLTATAPELPFGYSEDPKSDFYKMVREVYDISKTSTDEQKTIGLFWADVGVDRGYTPAGHILNVVTQALENKHADLGEASMVYAKSGIAIRDAIITLWKLKYHFNLIRPITYIRRVIDPNWLPLIATPAHPEYPSAHAYITGSAMQVLTRELGDHIPITDRTYTFLGFAPRYYPSFNSVEEEVSISRFYGGIHYRISLAVGMALGKKIGDKAADIKLLTNNY